MDPTIGSLSAYQIPALVPDPDLTSYTRTEPIEGGGITSFPVVIPLSLVTPVVVTPGNAWSLQHQYYAVELTFAQCPYGGIANISVDNQTLASFSTYSPQAQPIRFYNVHGDQQTITVSTDGTASSLAQTLTNESGDATLIANVTITPNGKPITSPGNYNLVGVVSGGNYSVQVKSGSTVLATVNQQTSNDTVLPGFTVIVSPGSSFDNASTATFTIVQPVVPLLIVGTYASPNNGAMYTSPVMDSGELNEAWPMVEVYVGNEGGVPSVQVGAGDNPVPDDSWTWVTMHGTYAVDLAGNPWGRLTCGTTYDQIPRGRFGQITGNLDGASWISDARIFHGNLEFDDLMSRIPPPQDGAGFNKPEMLLALSCLLAVYQQSAIELNQSCAIETASSVYLSLYGKDLKLQRNINESNDSYRTRLQYMFGSRKGGGTPAFLQRVLAGAFGLPLDLVQVSPYPRGSFEWVLGESVLGVSTVLGVQNFGYWRWTVSAPVNQMTIPIPTALQIIDQIRPTGTIVTFLPL